MPPPSHIVWNDQNDLFEHIRPLGIGNSQVDEVRRDELPGRTFARKCFMLQPNSDQGAKRNVQKEIAIMRRLRHGHIVSFKGSYERAHTPLFYVLISPVADTDLQGFLRQTDSLQGQDPRRTQNCQHMRRWPACLFRALSYVHSMSIRHKDIKPGNILIKSGDVLLADFGIANDFAGLTSGTAGRATATWCYAAPEVSVEARRGRSADIFSLGCVLVEICTVCSEETNSLQSLHDHRRGSLSTPPNYCDAPFLLFDWIWLSLHSCFSSADYNMASFIQKILQLAFLMLDPDPQQRITAGQLVDMLSDSRCKEFRDIADLACPKCRLTVGCPSRDIPLHSVFREENGRAIVPSKRGLTSETPQLWEHIKLRWLQEHIWWVEESFM